jgi:hypothetical protein
VNIIPCNHTVISCNITRCPSTMHHKEIELATKVEEEEALKEAED